MGLSYRCRVDEVFDAVQALAQKSNRGFLTATEFNSLARKAQIDIFNEAILKLTDKTSRHLALENLAPLIQDDAIEGYLDQNYLATQGSLKKTIFQLDETIPIVYVIGATTIGYSEKESEFTVTGETTNYYNFSLLELGNYVTTGDPTLSEPVYSDYTGNSSTFWWNQIVTYVDYVSSWDEIALNDSLSSWQFEGVPNTEYSGYWSTNIDFGEGDLEVKFINPTKLDEHFTSRLCPIDDSVAFGVHTRRVDPLAGVSNIAEGDDTAYPQEAQYIHVYSGRALDAIKIRYITTPHENPKYAVNSVTGIYDDEASQHFCLSKFSFSALVDKITVMLGISLRDSELVQSQLGQEQTNVD